MKNIIKNIKINNNLKAFGFIGAIQIIVMIIFTINHLSLPSFEPSFDKERNDYGNYNVIEAQKASVAPSKNTTSTEEKVEIIKPVKYVQNVIVSVIRTIKVSKIVPVVKVVVRKHKIEIIEMNSIPALSVSLETQNNNLVLDSFVKENEIITKNIEIIDSTEVTETDTIKTDSIYYVLDIYTIAKNEEPVKIETVIDNPNIKIIPIKWYSKKFWTKSDITKKIIANNKVTWVLHAEQNETTNKIENQSETTYGNENYPYSNSNEYNTATSDNMENDIVDISIHNNDVFMRCAKSPPPIYNRLHWEENKKIINFIYCQELLE